MEQITVTYTMHTFESLTERPVQNVDSALTLNTKLPKFLSVHGFQECVSARFVEPYEFFVKSCRADGLDINCPNDFGIAHVLCLHIVI